MSAADRLNEINSGPGWFEVIHPTRATTHIVYVHEDGSLYFPEGAQVLDHHEFAFADARGMAHRLVRSAALVAALQAVLDLHRTGPGEQDWCVDCGETSPCQTVRAIEGKIEETETHTEPNRS